jgi:hypothetical protein
VTVQMDHRKPGPPPELLGEDGPAGPAGPDHCDPLHASDYESGTSSVEARSSRLEAEGAP